MGLIIVSCSLFNSPLICKAPVNQANMIQASAFRHQQMFAHAAYQTVSQSQQSTSEASGKSESSAAHDKKNTPHETNMKSLPLAPLDANATPKKA